MNKHVLALALAASLPLGAHAETISLQGGLIDSTSVAPNFNGTTLSVTVRGYAAGGAQKDVAINSLGVGVDTGLLDAGEVNSSLGNDPGEYLTLSFNKAVQLNSLDFSLWEQGFDKATLSWGSNSVSLTQDLQSLSNVVGSTFTLRATGLASSFRLLNINAVAAVPEPATYALMGLGLAGIAVARRRRAA